MGNQIEFTYDNDRSEGLYYPSKCWDGSDDNVLTIEMPFSPTGDLKQLYLEAQEYDFLTGKTPQVQTDDRDEEIE